MADASFVQTNFLGGEISKTRQGRMEAEEYRTSLTVCRNALPIEEGAWQRRSGTAYCATTYRGQAAVLRSFYFNVANPYTIELTPNLARVFNAGGLVLDTSNQVAAINSSNPAQITTASIHGWSTGDEVVFFRTVAGDTSYSPGFLMNRSFLVTVVDTLNFTLRDPITGQGFDGSLVTLGSNPIGVGRVLHLSTPYGAVGAGDGVDGTKLVQGPGFALLCHSSVQPYVMATLSAPSANQPATFNVQAAQLVDGPYLDVPNDGSTLTPSGTSGSVTITFGQAQYAAGTTYAVGNIVYWNGNRYTSLQSSNTGNQPDISPTWWQLSVGTSGANQAQWFSTDVGRMVRLFSEPPAYAAGTTYAAGAIVKYAGVYWTSLIAGNVGNQPDISPTDWEINPSGAAWVWGTITSITDNLNAVVSLNGTLVNTNAISTYRLGVYSNTTGWPTCGCYYEGRLYLGGAVANRVDASSVNAPFNFSPTGTDGTVSDANAIAAPFQSETDNTVLWMQSEGQGVIIGTSGGEFFLSASQLSDPITPASVQVHRISKYRCENVLPVRTPLSSIFVQRYGKKLIEYISDVYSGKYSGTNIGGKAKHLFDGGIVELAFQQEAVPIVWARLNNKNLVGVTYRRDSPFGTQAAAFVGWHRHDHGFGRAFESIQSSITPGGSLDTLMVVTNDTTTNIRWVEVMMPLAQETDDITQGWYVDGGAAAAGASISGSTLSLNGYYYLAGKTVDLEIAGVDAGSATVSATGALTVDISGASSLLTAARIAAVSQLGLDYTLLGTTVLGTPTGTVMLPSLGTISNYKITTPAGTINNPASDTIWVDWGNKVVLTAGHAPDGYRKHQMVGGVEYQSLSGTQWAAALPAGDLESTAFPNQSAAGYNNSAVDREGYLLFPAGGTNYVTIRRANYGSLLPSSNNHLGHQGNLSGIFPAPASLISVPVGKLDYIIQTGGSGTQALSWFLSTTMSGYGSISAFPTDGRLTWQALLVKGHVSTQMASTEVWSVAGPTASANTVSYPVYLQFGKLLLAGVTQKFTPGPKVYPSTIVTASPGINCIGFSQPIFDALDGGLILMLQFQKAINWSNLTNYHALGASSDQVVGSDNNVYTAILDSGPSGVGAKDPTLNPSYWQNIGSNSYTLRPFWLVKINPISGNIVWKTQITGITSIPGFRGAEQTRLTGSGVLAVLFGDGNLAAVNTSTGALTVIGAANGVTNPRGQVYDDVSGNFVFYADYSKSGALLPQPAADGTPNSFSTWAFFGGTPNVTFSGATPPNTFPAVVGGSFTSQGQLVRPVAEGETGARNGPALGKTRRVHQYSMLLSNTQGIQAGMSFTGTPPMYAVDLLATDKTTPLPKTALFSGVAWGNVDADYDFDNMFAWQVNRPYPCTVLAVSNFVHTQDR